MNPEAPARRSRARRTSTSLLTGAIALSLALVLAACASGAEDADSGDVDADAAGDVEAGEVSLVANPWPGSYANAAVASIILENEMGADVTIVEIDENAQWAGLDDGTLDAQLEVWLSGHVDNYATYIDELGTVVDAGPLGAVGQIGWFVPTYVLEDYPEMATWEGLVGNESVFATAETGSSGQFLAADPSFVQFEEAIIDNLGLDLEVIQSGSEAAQLTAVESAISREEPVLFYFYTPHWMHAQHDLTMVELPEWTEECEAKPESERDCGYPEDVLFKIVSAELETSQPEVFAFLSNFTMENAWQDEITHAMDVEGKEAMEAAQDWVDANEDVWSAWLP